jgi:ATP-dependent Lon protease
VKLKYLRLSKTFPQNIKSLKRYEENFLREMRAIEEELGDKEDKEVNEYRAKIKRAKMREVEEKQLRAA